MRLIDADFAEDLLLMHEQNAKAFGKTEYAKGIRTAYADVSACCRTIKDAVVVVRCKDCIWFQPDSVWNNGEFIRYLKEDEFVTVDEGINVQSYCENPRWHHLDGHMYITKEHYCSYGERKEK